MSHKTMMMTSETYDELTRAVRNKTQKLTIATATTKAVKLKRRINIKKKMMNVKRV
jgi:hypothetical protein